METQERGINVISRLRVEIESRKLALETEMKNKSGFESRKRLAQAKRRSTIDTLEWVLSLMEDAI